MGQNTVTVTDATFKDTIASTTPTVVDFWAEWCAPCRAIAPALEEIAGEYAGKLTVAKLNVDENQQTPVDYGVMGIPTLMVFKDGVEKKRLVGARGKDALKQELQEFVA